MSLPEKVYTSLRVRGKRKTINDVDTFVLCPCTSCKFENEIKYNTARGHVRRYGRMLGEPNPVLYEQPGVDEQDNEDVLEHVDNEYQSDASDEIVYDIEDADDEEEDVLRGLCHLVVEIKQQYALPWQAVVAIARVYADVADPFLANMDMFLPRTQWQIQKGADMSQHAFPLGDVCPVNGDYVYWPHDDLQICPVCGQDREHPSNKLQVYVIIVQYQS